MRRSRIPPLVWAALSTISLAACQVSAPAPTPAPTKQDPAAAVAVETTPHDTAQAAPEPRSLPSPANSEDESKSTDEGDEGDEDESKSTDEGDEGDESDESDEGARLCTRPYLLSGTPGKGSSSANAARSASDDAAATRKLAQGLELSIDGGPRQSWTTKRGAEFDGLASHSPHTVEVFDSRGKRLKRLVLDFEARESEDLCLGYDDFYGSWQLRKLRSGQRCGPCVTR